MTWWNRKSKPEDPGEPNHVFLTEKVSIEKIKEMYPPPDPEPEKTDTQGKTKPEDRVRYRIGLSCPNGHVVALSLDNCLENIPTGEWVCPKCSLPARKATFKETAEYFLNYVLGSYSSTRPNGYRIWDLNHGTETYEFVRYLDDPKPRRKKVAKKK